ncbi:eCIS core domain-containing protein [Nitriliruptor alkaliphilus]|uniref:eCIS core domain-containing protein n=1 Tax=Nitriliruptor alkaliphilus TaxID=427918 RepID=UPI0006984B95|nr:DUF4157 domain-containing protein [Nitriliruptor alkaliphilus]
MSAGRRLGAAGTVATLAAGLVGLARQRSEAQRVRRGELPPASAASDPRAALPQGRLGERISAWAPARPTTPGGRAAATLWASPLTAVGLLLAALAGRRPRWDTTHGCFVVDGMRGPSAHALRAVGASANTIGQVVLSRYEQTPEVLLAHEVVHVRQTERLGPLMFPAYVWLGARYGYRDHPLERSARAGARRAVGPR